MTTMKQKIWQYLPRDILHCVYCEWLTWSDLSLLDIACVSGEDREEWLSSVSAMVMLERWPSVDMRLVNFYKWLGSRKVLVRDGFPIRLSVLDNLLSCCDYVTLCPAIHSIMIMHDHEMTNAIFRDTSRLDSSLSSFFRHCSHVKEAEFVSWGGWNSNCGWRDGIVYTTLTENLQDNQLETLKLSFAHFDGVVYEKLAGLLSKHLYSLKDLQIFDQTEGCLGLVHVLESLIKSKHGLRVLNIILKMHNDPSSLILQYLSTAGKSLEKIKSFGSGGFFSSDLLRFIGTSCPNLEELSWFHGGVHSVEENLKPIEIYQLCPKFKFIGYNIFKIMNDGKNRSRLCFELCNTGWENGIECVLLSLQRGKYTQVKLNVYPLVVDWNLVTSNLGSLVTSLMLEETSEDVLISLLPDLPRLQELDVKPSHTFTDKILPVIAEHGQKLIKLCLTARNDSSEFNFTEEMTCQMISKCNMLEVLEISCVGCESILYAAYHLLRLRKVKFHHPKSSKEDIVSLFRGEEVEWSSYLREGKIGGVLKYDQSSRSWVDEIHTNTGMHW